MSRPKIIKQLKLKNPNLSRSDLEIIIDTICQNINLSLKKGEKIELRGFGTFRTNTQKASIRRNPKTGAKVNVPKKRVIKWKMSKDLFKKLNNET